MRSIFCPSRSAILPCLRSPRRSVWTAVEPRGNRFGVVSLEETPRKRTPTLDVAVRIVDRARDFVAGGYRLNRYVAFVGPRVSTRRSVTRTVGADTPWSRNDFRRRSCRRTAHGHSIVRSAERRSPIPVLLQRFRNWNVDRTACSDRFDQIRHGQLTLVPPEIAITEPRVRSSTQIERPRSSRGPTERRLPNRFPAPRYRQFI